MTDQFAARASRLLADRPVLVLWAALVLHLLAWTIIPTSLAASLPNDTVEALYWGREWPIGLWKHPPLSAWMAELATHWFRPALWPIFALSALCGATALACVYLLAAQMLPRSAAVAAMLFVQASALPSVTAHEFNANVAMLPFWALILVAAWFALTRGNWIDWLSLGAVAALGFLAKYQTGCLLVALGLFTLFNRQARRSLTTPGPYVAVALFAALIAPNMIWIARQGFTGFAHAVRVEHGLTEMIKGNAEALFGGGFLLFFGVALFGALWWRERGSIAPQEAPASAFAKSYVGWMLFAPFAVLIVPALAVGATLKTPWFMPFGLLAGIFLLLHWPAMAEDIAAGLLPKRVISAWAAIMAVLFVGLPLYIAGSLVYGRDPPYLRHDGRKVAADIADAWSSEQKTPVPAIVALTRLGSVAGGMAAYLLSERPTMALDPSLGLAQWVTTADIARTGAVVISTGAPLQRGDRYQGLCIVPKSRGVWHPASTRYHEPHPMHLGVIRPGTTPDAPCG